MICATAEEIHARCERIREKIPALDLIEGESVAGGGSTPEQTLTHVAAAPSLETLSPSSENCDRARRRLSAALKTIAWCWI